MREMGLFPLKVSPQHLPSDWTALSSSETAAGRALALQGSTQSSTSRSQTKQFR